MGCLGFMSHQQYGGAQRVGGKVFERQQRPVQDGFWEGERGLNMFADVRVWQIYTICTIYSHLNLKMYT